MMQSTGYSNCKWQPYTFGIAGLYTAMRPPVALGVAMTFASRKPVGSDPGAELGR